MATLTMTPTSDQLAVKLQEIVSERAGTPQASAIPNFNKVPNLIDFFIFTLNLYVTFVTLAALKRMYTKVIISRSTVYEDYQS